MIRPTVICLLTCVLCAACLSNAHPGESDQTAQTSSVTFEKNDHIAIIGNSLAERMQHDGTLEALLYKTFPDHDLVFRNLGFPADTIEHRERSDNFGSPDDWLKRVKADVVWAFFGFNESFDGKDGVSSFKDQAKRFVEHTLNSDYSGKNATPRTRLVLFSPIAQEHGTNPTWADPTQRNADLSLYANALAEVAHQEHVPYIDLYSLSQQAFSGAAHPLTLNGFHLLDAGYEALAPAMLQALVPSASAASLTLDGKTQLIRTAVRTRNEMWFSRYRTVDGFNVYGGRSQLSFDGVTNYQVMQEEMTVRDVMTANRDRAIWSTIHGQNAEIDDSNCPPVTKLKTTKTDPTPYLSGEDAIAKMTCPKGVQINLFASEERFPELAKPVQMAWDTKGRLWVCAWATYPERTPWDKKGDSILIFEDSKNTGKADRCITFLDGLNCPTGFQFVAGGILLMQSPDLWYVPIDPKTGLAGHKVRVLGNIDSADSHHTSNAMCLDPGGATYLSDGLFHVTQVETAQGPLRHWGPAIYRYEPDTQHFEVYANYPFANPHGRVFDYWGNDFITDATGNNNYFGPAISGHTAKDRYHESIKNFWPNPSRPCPGTGILSSSAWPADYNGNFLNCNVIGFQGVFRAVIKRDGAGLLGESVESLISSSDPNFRPTAVDVGPDGAVYVADWSNAIIGHMQYNIRDPLRDHIHGRIYRLTYEGKTLPRPEIAGQGIPALLELLKSPENNTRERAKIELSKHETRDVLLGVDRWIATLDTKDPAYQHHLCEALWVKQWNHTVDLPLLKRLLASPDYHARSAATRVLCYQRDRIPEALTLLQAEIADPEPRVRLEVVRTLSFFPQWEAADVALQLLASAQQPLDYYLTYILSETMRQLEPQWHAALNDGKAIAAGNPAGMAYLIDHLSTGDLTHLPKNQGVWLAIFSRGDATLEMRQDALSMLAKDRHLSVLATLLDILRPLMRDHEVQLADACHLLLLLSPSELEAGRADLTSLNTPANPALVRASAIAGLMVADQSVDKQWQLVAPNLDPVNATGPAQLHDLLGAVRLIPDAKIRQGAFAKVMSLLKTSYLPSLPLLDAELIKQKGVEGRYVRVYLPRRGTLSLAEVQVWSDGRNIAGSGTASQISTNFGGDARRAIDGNTSGNFGDNTVTHTNENEDQPWWEVDLGRLHLIDRVTVWNRTDNGYDKRLADFRVVVLDSNHLKVMETPSNPTPEPSVQLSLESPGNARASLVRDAVDTILATGGDKKAIFSQLIDLLAHGQAITATSHVIRMLPRVSWSKEHVSEAVAQIIDWSKGIPLTDLNQLGVIETIDVAKDLLTLLPEDDTKAQRGALGAFSVPEFFLATVREQMRYDTKRLVVEAGKPFEIHLTNKDSQPHNLVIVKPGAAQEIGTAAQTMRPDQPDDQGRILIPRSDKVIAATRAVFPDQSERLILVAPQQEGEYDFLCTFPAHWLMMRGTLVVTRDPKAWLAAHP